MCWSQDVLYLEASLYNIVILQVTSMDTWQHTADGIGSPLSYLICTALLHTLRSPLLAGTNFSDFPNLLIWRVLILADL